MYINNIIIFNKTAKVYFKDFQIVFNIIGKYRIYIGADKLFVGYLSVKLLNYIVNKKAINRINNRITTFK